MVLILFSFLFMLASPAQAQTGPMSPIFERVWSVAKNEIYPASLANQFSTARYEELSARAAQANTLEELSQVMNPFLLSLGVSHTKFYQSKDPDYFFMRSLFSSRNPDSHPLWHIGIQVVERPEGIRVREVLEGYPAETAGLKRGDRLLSCDGMPFHSVDCFASGRKASLTIDRNGMLTSVEVTPIYESPARSFIQAMKNSVRIYQRAGLRIGYIHFWIGAFEENIREYEQIIRQELFTNDALILDLRGGFGGASLERLDLFFPDRTTYAMMTGIHRDGSVTSSEAWEPHQNLNPYTKPMIVMINEGVRSGKEMLAFQFKKTARATLVGTTTAGMFVAGRMWFSDQNEDYMLYLASTGALLDGVNLEGVGVRPDVEIPYPTDKTLENDPQLAAALNLL